MSTATIAITIWLLKIIKAALKLYGGELPDITVVSVATQPYDTGYIEQPVVIAV